MKRVLVVDDSPVVLATAKHALEQVGFAVETRTTVDELSAGGTDDFDLILIDVQMPELFGDDVAAVLRHERAVRVPIYLYSTLDEAELAQRAADAHVDGYISKQGGPEHLVAEVQRILA